MRIVGGQWRGRNFTVNKKLELRPTTNFAKEGLFNILENNYGLEGLKVLELFSGTGNVTFEFLSRGVESVLGIENNQLCISHLHKTAEFFGAENAKFLKKDVFEFLKNNSSQSKFDIIFADPPFENGDIENIPDMVFNGQWLVKEGWLILEHAPGKDFSNHKYFLRHRKYGHVNFSIFENTENN